MSNWFKRFEKELLEYSSYFRIVKSKKPYAYVYWKGYIFEQVISSLMKEYSYDYTPTKDKKSLFIPGYKSTLFSMKKRLYVLNNPITQKELKQKK